MCAPVAKDGCFAVLSGRRLLLVRSVTLSRAMQHGLPHALLEGGPEWRIQWECALEHVLRIDRDEATVTGEQILAR